MNISKVLILSMCGVVVTALLLYKGCKNSIDERGSYTTAAYSSQDAREYGALISTVTAEPSSFKCRGKFVSIKEAWVERMSQVHYTLLFFKSREYFDEYRLIIRFNDSAANEADFVLSSDLRFPFMVQSNGEIYVKSLYLGKEYADSLSVTVEENNIPIDTLRFALK